MIVRFFLKPSDSIEVVASRIEAVRETNSDLVIYLTSGTQVRVPASDDNRAAVTLWGQSYEQSLHAVS